MKRGFPSVELLRQCVQKGSYDNKAPHVKHGEEYPLGPPKLSRLSHPRWVRINTLKTSLDEQLETTFSEYQRVDELETIIKASDLGSEPETVLYIDRNVPDLIALPSSVNVSSLPAYSNGSIIIQDKASCFPAYLLDHRASDGRCLDACAAPGNKTTHLVALLGLGESARRARVIYACERDQTRARTLEAMVSQAGAKDRVTMHGGQDFLNLNPTEQPWSTIKALLLDPSCSGSGIIGRDDIPYVAVPQKMEVLMAKTTSKEKRQEGYRPGVRPASESNTFVVYKDVTVQESLEEQRPLTQRSHDDPKLRSRLEALSAFQLKLLLHAFHFPSAQKITYSTCSVYAEENEHVVLKALSSSIARKQGWRILRRGEQVPGLRKWKIRGDIDACRESGLGSTFGNEALETIADACIRSRPGTKEGTQGFFVAGLFRGEDKLGGSSDAATSASEDEEWEGFA